MKWLDLLLNVVLLLLWLNWRTARLDQIPTVSRSSLLVMLKRPRSSRLGSWLSLIALPALLLLRAGLYRQIGSAMNWTAQLDLGVIALPFHSEFGERVLLFSVLSFAWFFLKFYVWLLVISVVNRSESEPGMILKFVRLQLGRFERLPAVGKLALPVLLVTIGWVAVTPLMLKLGIVPKPSSELHVIAQGAIIGCSAYLSASYLLACIIFLHFLNTYVYLGDFVLWQFVSTTARRLLKPFLIIRVGRWDFSPLVGLVVVVLLAQFADHVLAQLYQQVPR